jgi:hypothetical protein
MMVKRKYEVKIRISITEANIIKEFVSGKAYPEILEDNFHLIYTIFKRINKAIK